MQDMLAEDVQAKFNCLFGSNTRPRALFQTVQGENQARLENQNVYFDSLKQCACADDLALPGDLIQSGKRAVIKCVGNTYVTFDEIYLPFGKMTNSEFTRRVLQR